LAGAGFGKNGRISDLPEPKSGATLNVIRYYNKILPPPPPIIQFLLNSPTFPCVIPGQAISPVNLLLRIIEAGLFYTLHPAPDAKQLH